MDSWSAHRKCVPLSNVNGPVYSWADERHCELDLLTWFTHNADPKALAKQRPAKSMNITTMKPSSRLSSVERLLGVLVIFFITCKTPVLLLIWETPVMANQITILISCENAALIRLNL